MAQRSSGCDSECERCVSARTAWRMLSWTRTRTAMENGMNSGICNRVVLSGTFDLRSMMPHVDDHGDWDRDKVAQTESGWCLRRAHLCPASTVHHLQSEAAKLRLETNLTPVTQKHTQGQQKKKKQQSGKRERAPIDFFDSQQQA
jgi:hypothetical protein